MCLVDIIIRDPRTQPDVRFHLRQIPVQHVSSINALAPYIGIRMSRSLVNHCFNVMLELALVVEPIQFTGANARSSSPIGQRFGFSR